MSMTVDESQPIPQNNTDIHLNGMTNGQHNHSNGHHQRSNKTGKHKSSNKEKHRSKEQRDYSTHSNKNGSRGKEKHGNSSSSSNTNKHREKNRVCGSQAGSSHSNNHDKEKERKDKYHKFSSLNHKSSLGRREVHEKGERDNLNTSASSNRDKCKGGYSQSSSPTMHYKDRDRDHHHKNSSSSSKHRHSTSKSHSSRSKSDHHCHHDGEFMKPAPLVCTNGEDGLQNGNINGDVMAVDIKKEVTSQILCNNGFENDDFELKREIKVENRSLNLSETSSCDYSLSQFKDDEPQFEVKGENFSYVEEYEDELSLNNSKSVREKLESEEEDENIPLSKRKMKTEDEDDVPLLIRKKHKKESKLKDTVKRHIKDDSEYSTYKKKVKKIHEKSDITSPMKSGRKLKQEEEESEVWRWWEEAKREDGIKWTTLEHNGPVFAPTYERIPKNVHFYYDCKQMELSELTEEVATFYAKMLNHDYCTKQIFNENFFKDFRKVMTTQEREIIKDFKKCNFEEMHKYFLAESEKRKNATKEEKLAKKEENEALIKKYGVCIIDGHKEKIGNFRLEPPGLFRGRGEHPKMGMIKKRIRAEDVSINCGKDSKIPSPPPGHRWKEVVHNNTVTWLASWIENVQGQVKYIMLNPSSKLKGEKDHIKYETARRLDKSIEKIRATYRDEWKSKEMRVRQRAVALYFIDKLALRAGNEKDEDQADTVGCCSLRVEHVTLHKELNGKEYLVVFDFLGKDSIRYYNEVQVEKRVFKNLEIFMENKKKGDDLFDRLNTQVLNEHLKELMEGLTAKVFRTYNASITLQNQLDLLTKEEMTIPEKLLAYNRANRAVAILCNHQRSVPKSHEKSMETLKEKIRLKYQAIEDCEAEYNDAKRAAKRGSVKEKIIADKKGKQLERLKEQLKKMELQETDKDENKTIALGTSKLNYLDPRISVAWCKKYGVPIEKIFNKTQRNKFMWAIHMADADYRF